MARFVRAWESADIDALVARLTDDVFTSMPPMSFEYEGRDVAAASAPACSARAMTRFDNSVLPWFGLPRSLPSR